MPRAAPSSPSRIVCLPWTPWMSASIWEISVMSLSCWRTLRSISTGPIVMPPP